MKINGFVLVLILLAVVLFTSIISFVIGVISVPRRMGPSYSTTDPDTMNLIHSINTKLDKYKKSACGSIAGKDIKKVLDKYLPGIITPCTPADPQGDTITNKIVSLVSGLFPNGIPPLTVTTFLLTQLPVIVNDYCTTYSSNEQNVNDLSTKICMLIDAMC